MRSEIVSYSTAKIAEHQLDAQIKAMDEEIARVSRHLLPEGGGEIWPVYEGLKIERTFLVQAKRDLEKAPVMRKRWWDSLRFRLYLWSVRDRF